MMRNGWARRSTLGNEDSPRRPEGVSKTGLLIAKEVMALLSRDCLVLCLQMWGWLSRALCGCETICGVDTDFLLSYATPKYVRIVDRRLGILNHVLTGAILAYVLIYQIWFRGGYLATFPVSGFSRFNLLQPTVGGCDPTKPPTAAGGVCYNDFRNASSLPYCTQSESPYTGNKLPCQYLDSIAVETLGPDSIIIATRQSASRQVLKCEVGAENCPEVYTHPQHDNKTYVADVERFTLLIDHGVSAAGLGLFGASRSMEGRLKVESNHELCSQNPNSTTSQWGTRKAQRAPCWIKPNRTRDGLDFMTVDTLISAAGVSLDDINLNNETFRETGAVVSISIEYTNFKGWLGLTREITYQYTVTVMPDSEYKILQPTFDIYPTTRTVLNTHGLYVRAYLTGYLHGSSFQSFLINLTTSLTLLAITTTVVDLLAMWVMADRKRYRDLKYEQSADLSELREKERRRRERRRKGAHVDDKEGMETARQGDEDEGQEEGEDQVEGGGGHRERHSTDSEGGQASEVLQRDGIERFRVPFIRHPSR